MDITRVLSLNTRQFKASTCLSDAQFEFLSITRLQELCNQSKFDLSKSFTDDFISLGFTGIAAKVHNEVVGVCFLATMSIVSRHNRGGDNFHGIGIRLPANTQFLFKVEVEPDWRGQRINAAMIRFAIEQLGTKQLAQIVTTTDWRNQAFLNSAYRQGFQNVGWASEFVLAGKHFYQRPKTLFGASASLA